MELNSILKRLINTDFTILFHEAEFDKGIPDSLEKSPDEYTDKFTTNLLFDSDINYWDFDLIADSQTFESLTTNYRTLDYMFDLYFESLLNDITNSLRKTKHSKEEGKAYGTILNEVAQELNRTIDLYTSDRLVLNDQVEPGMKNMYPNPLLKRHIDTSINFKPENKRTDSWYYDFTISKYYDSQSKSLELLKQLIASELTDKDIVVQNQSNNKSALKWTSSDTDLLELVVALLETQSVTAENGSISRKELVSILGKVFGRDIKDFESKLTFATNRKKNRSPFLDKLKIAYENYCDDKLNRQN